MITSVLGSREDARIPSGEAGGEASADAWIPWGGKHAQCCACFPPLTMTDESQLWSARRAEKLQNARAPQKVEGFVETTGITLEAAVECALWRSAGLDRALKIDPGAKNITKFSGSVAPKKAQKWPNFPCDQLSDTRIPGAEKRRSPENDARIP